MAGNPILQALGQLSVGSDKSAILQQAKALMGGNNPLMDTVRAMVAGKDPQQVFYAECQRRGVNPDDILALLKMM